MKNIRQNQPILLSGVNRLPLPNTSSSQVDISLSDRSHRWLLIDKLCVQVDARQGLPVSVQRNPQETADLCAAMYEAKIGTKLVSLTDDWVPLLMLSQMISAIAETEPFAGIETAADVSATNVNFLEWVLPRPLLLRPGEALRFSFRLKAVNDIVGVPNQNGLTDLGFTLPGALFNVAAKGTIVRVDAKMTKSRQVPYLVAQTFDARDVTGGTVAGSNGRKMTKVLENKTSKILHMHSMLGRWLKWDSGGVPTTMVQPNNLDLEPLMTLVDYAGYDVCKRVPLQTVFPAQVSGSLRFEGAMQPRDVLKITLEQNPLDATETPIFFAPVQALVALTGWREEAL